MLLASKTNKMEHMRIHIRNYGCSTNQADGEALAGCLTQAGFTLTSSVSAADLIVYNTCAVKGPTENRIISAIKRTPKNKKIIVAGCLPLINFNRLSREAHFDAVVGPAAAEEIVNVVHRVLSGEQIIAIKDALTNKPPLDIPRLRTNSEISIIPISYGCLGKCAYCCVTFARGNLRSYTINEIVARVQKDLSGGVREFWLTSQDTACYGWDIGTNLAELLFALTSIDADFRLRVGMMTPNTVAPLLADLLDAFGDERIFKFVHLPVQSGDNAVLRRMHRFYTVEDFKNIVNAFKTAFPNITLATDIICGFPGETQTAFQHTLELVQETRPDIINISKFFPRPRTVAAEMRSEFLPLQEIKKRSTRVAALAKRISLECNKRWVGWKGDVLIDEKGKISGSWIGRNFAYKPVVVNSQLNLLGKFVTVEITKVFPTYLAGKLC
ncbi:MAG: tRNA (N(6)-L-threonylcarbamoyladenosine(37)-C(2))-methylthiotransferase [Candidatus Bathyarchaeia archaeon]